MNSSLSLVLHLRGGAEGYRNPSSSTYYKYAQRPTEPGPIVQYPSLIRPYVVDKMEEMLAMEIENLEVKHLFTDLLQL